MINNVAVNFKFTKKFFLYILVDTLQAAALCVYL